MKTCRRCHLQHLQVTSCKCRQSKGDALRKVAQSIAGHIRNPYSADEIAAIIESGDYSAEMMIQHLLLIATNSATKTPHYQTSNYTKP